MKRPRKGTVSKGTPAPREVPRSESRRLEVTSGPGEVREIPLIHIQRDPSQPRKKFRRSAIEELAQSIDAQGLQQYPSVNVSHIKGGVTFYTLKTGERRFKAHQLLGKETMLCVVLPGKYDGQTFSGKRLLAQTSENFAREPHTHCELIDVVRKYIEEQLEGVSKEERWGIKSKAIREIALALGRSEAWVSNYDTLSRLSPEIRDLLDEEDPNKRLNFSVALSLARAPFARQKEIWGQAQVVEKDSGFKAMQSFVTRVSRSAKVEAGEKVRGRRPSDDKVKFNRMLNQLLNAVKGNSAGQSQSDFEGFVIKGMKGMRGPDMLLVQNSLDFLLAQLRIVSDAVAKVRKEKVITAR